jgi:DNA-binding NarL/FixJ family response regulator
VGARKLKAADGATGRARILLVDDHPLTREGLAQVLQREPDFCVCGEAGDRHAALEIIKATQPHIAIVDLVLKDCDGLELIKDIHAQFPKVLVLVVSMQDERFYAERTLRAGASGFVSKEDAADNVVQAVRQLLRGELYLSQRLATQLAARIVGHPPTVARASSEALSDRELQVLQLLGDGLSRQQIAERLHLDVNTVETYRSRIKEKLQLKDAGELRQYAIRSRNGGMNTLY